MLILFFLLLPNRYHIINSLRPSELVVKSNVVSAAAAIEEGTQQNALDSGSEKKAKFRIKINTGKKSKKDHHVKSETNKRIVILSL